MTADSSRITMKVDEGAIVGGFPHAYDAAMVDAPGSPVQRSIAAATGMRSEWSVSVSVTRADGTTWERWFSSTFNRDTQNCIFTTPNPYRLGVRVCGTAYFVDVEKPDDPEASLSEVLPLECAASDHVRGRMFLANFFEVYAFDGVRVMWISRRVSLDGIQNLAYAGGKVYGIGTAVGVDAVPFTIDAETGEAIGGFEGFGITDDPIEQ
jgi:hypothetical protein